jgi:hypothetical protein
MQRKLIPVSFGMVNSFIVLAEKKNVFERFISEVMFSLVIEIYLYTHLTQFNGRSIMRLVINLLFA